MKRPQIERVALGLIAVFMLPAGLQATLAPKSFFDDFPLGRGWIAHQGDAYNEHLVRDVGALFLALIVATAWTAWRSGPARPSRWSPCGPAGPSTRRTHDEPACAAPDRCRGG